MNLPAIFHRTPFVIIGARAANLYMPPRFTLDTDILVHADDANAAEEELLHSGAVRIGPLAIPGESWRLAEGDVLDVLHGSAPWLAEGLARPRLSAEGQPCLDLPWLILMKLEASRTQDLADITRMLGTATEEDLARIRAVILRYSPADKDDFESMIHLGRLEWRGME